VLSPPTPPRPALAPGFFLAPSSLVSHNLSPPPHIFASWVLDQQLSFLPTPGRVLCEVTIVLRAFTIPPTSIPGIPCALPWNLLRHFSNALRPLDLLDQRFRVHLRHLPTFLTNKQVPVREAPPFQVDLRQHQHTEPIRSPKLHRASLKRPRFLATPQTKDHRNHL